MAKEKFWSGKKVLVTGNTGFKGTWICWWLQLLGAEVAGFSLPPPTSPSMYELTKAEGSVNQTCGDVRDLEAVEKVFSDFQPEIVLHLAAQAIVRASYSDPAGTFSTNVMGTVNVLEASRRAGCVRAIVNVTSDKCYENRGSGRAFTEDDPMGGFDPYSSSKGCAELVTSAYRNSFFSNGAEGAGCALASARAGNVIGGGDWGQDRLVPDIFRAFIDNRPVIIRNPKAVRPWQHVLEPLRGYLMLARKLYTKGSEFAGGWNFGPEVTDAKPVSWIVEEISRLWGPDAKMELDRGVNPHEAALLALDCSRARDRLGWRPVLDITAALEMSTGWYKLFSRDPSALLSFTEKQILEYMELVGKQRE